MLVSNAVKKKGKRKKEIAGETSPNTTWTGACADGFGPGPEYSLVLVLVIVGCLLPNKLLDNDDEPLASAKCDPATPASNQA